MAQYPTPGGTTSPAAAAPVSDPFGPGFGVIPTNAPSTASTAGVNNATPIFPGASVSPYYLSQIGQTQITLGAGLGTGGQMSLDQAINFFDSLPPSELRYWEGLLAQAGFYTDSNGNPLKTAPVLGTLDDQGRRAFLNVLIAASSSGQSVTDTINGAIQSGQGAELRSTLPGAVTGGANVYTIDLTQPGAVNEVANSIFQATDGRNATAEELAKITDAVNSGVISQGLAKRAGAENASMQQYQTRVNQRDIQYQFETNPKAALGPVPSGPIANPAQYATTLLQYMGAGGQTIPITASNVAFIMGWIQANGTGMGGMNPLGSQNAVPGSQPTQGAAPTYINWEQSLYATASALQQFPNVLAALTSGDASSQAGNSAVQAELGRWSDGKYTNITSQAKASQGAAARQAEVSQQQSPPVAPGPGGLAAQVPGELQNLPGYQAFIKGGGTPSQWLAAQVQNQGTGPGSAGVPGTAQSMGAEGGGPLNPATIPAAEVVTPGQQQTNPGDQYINPTTVFSQNPLSPEQAAYLEATTGPNRFSFAENNALHAFLAVAQMIQAGHPTGA